MEQPLYTPCPVSNCRNSRKDFHTFWYHDSCGGRSNIRYEDITLTCDSCHKRAIMFDWLFKCSEHDFQRGSQQGWLLALSVMGQHKGNLKGIQKAIRKIGQRI